jgi:hypothetical protein
MSKLEVDKVTPQSGTTLTIGEAGDTTVINGLGTLPATIGTASQILQVNSGATGIEFGTPVDGNNLNATNLTSGTIPDGRFPSILPAAGGQNLTSLQPAAIVGGTFGAINAQNLTNIPGEISWQSTIITTNSTIVASRGYWINTTSGAVTITLPASASVGDRIILTDYLRTWGTNALTINQNSLNFQGSSSVNPVYNTSGQSVDLVYSGATQGWIPNSDDDVSDESVVRYSSDFLVVAGGGGGARNIGGGGGAGGFRTSTQNFSVGTTYTITVGDGGAIQANDNTVGNLGSNSSISGTDLTTITSAGGGGGGAGPDQTTARDGQNGGSGGGGCGDAPAGAAGSGDTPSTSPSQGNNGSAGSGAGSNYGAGAGGGAGAVGGTPSGSAGGNGGNGTANSITGTSVTYAGGGGGGTYNGGTAGTGGTGGGGNGSVGGSSPGPTAGGVNTGGGGGGQGRGSAGNAEAGGKGVVILSMLDADYSGTTSGSPTVATGVSGKTILTFTGTGSYTA